MINIKYFMTTAIILISITGILGLAMADAGDDPDVDLFMKHLENKLGKKQFNICNKATGHQLEIVARCAELFWEHCWSMKSKQVAMKCRAFSDYLKVQVYPDLMERAVNRGDKRAYKYYEDRYTSAVAEMDQLSRQIR